jgi:hypothetical protein
MTLFRRTRANQDRGAIALLRETNRNLAACSSLTPELWRLIDVDDLTLLSGYLVVTSLD